MAAYGDFLSVFPELKRLILIWTKKDHSDERSIRGILLDDSAGGIRRKKFTSGNTAMDMYDESVLYVETRYKDRVHIGDYFHHPDESYLMRVCHQREFNFAADYIAWDVERVGGSTPDQDQELHVEGGYIA